MDLVLGQPRDLTYSCRINMRPVPKAAIKHTRHGKGYYPKSTYIAMNRIKAETLERKLDLFESGLDSMTNPSDPIFTQAVSVSIIFSFIRPKSVSSHDRPYPSVVPDIDNLAKLTLDSLQPHIIEDDCLIVTLKKRKIYDDEEYIDIFIKDLL